MFSRFFFLFASYGVVEFTIIEVDTWKRRFGFVVDLFTKYSNLNRTYGRRKKTYNSYVLMVFRDVLKICYVFHGASFFFHASFPRVCK